MTIFFINKCVEGKACCKVPYDVVIVFGFEICLTFCVIFYDFFSCRKCDDNIFEQICT